MYITVESCSLLKKISAENKLKEKRQDAILDVVEKAFKFAKKEGLGE